MSQRYGKSVRHNPLRGCELTVYAQDPDYPGNANITAGLLTAYGTDCAHPNSAMYVGYGGGHMEAISGLEAEHIVAGLDRFHNLHNNVEVVPSDRLDSIAPGLGAMLVVPEIELGDTALQDALAGAELDGAFVSTFQA